MVVRSQVKKKIKVTKNPQKFIIQEWLLQKPMMCVNFHDSRQDVFVLQKQALLEEQLYNQIVRIYLLKNIPSSLPLTHSALKIVIIFTVVQK